MFFTKHLRSTSQLLKPTSIKLDEVCDLATFQVNADCVVDLDQGVGIANGAGIVGHQVGDSLGANEDLLHLAQLVLQRKRRAGLKQNIQCAHNSTVND